MTRVAALVLAAGLGRRFGGMKMLAEVDGVPLVRAAAIAALSSRAAPVVVICGHAHRHVETALTALDVDIVQNADFATGMASSLKAGIAAVPADIDGVLVMLADMPFVRSQTLDALIARFAERSDEIDAVVPTIDGRPGNPVLIGRGLFVRLKTLQGDEGARRLLSTLSPRLDRLAVSDPGITIDIDTQADLDAWQSGCGPSQASA